MTNPAFYGGGHSMGSAQDFAYWCMNTTTIYKSRTDLFVPPRVALNDVTYGRIAGCVENAGGTIPLSYADLYDWLLESRSIVSVQKAITTRGALLLNAGTVTVSLGDSHRVVVEENYRLVQKYVNRDLDPKTLFEYGALLPSLDYL